MSPKLPRDVDGSRLVRTLCKSFGYELKNQVGSHVTLQLKAAGGHLAIPQHKALRIGTLGTILALFEQQTGQSRDELLKLL